MLNKTALDLDGVIFDYEKTFLKQAAKLNLYISIKRPEIYFMAERYEITQETVSLINSNIDFSDMDIFEEVLNLKHYINNIKCFITSSPLDILHLRKTNTSKIFGKDIPVYYAEPGEKHRIISEVGIKYFIDDYNAVIHHIDLNCSDCKAYWLNRGYKDETLPEPVNKINNLTEFFERIIMKETKFSNVLLNSKAYI
ncbi:MAG: hypothetical protein ACYDDB_08400 [bacterium]